MNIHKYTSFEIAGISSLIVTLGDTLWLVKDSLHLDNRIYIIIGIILLTGLASSIASMVRYEKRRKKFLAKKKKMRSKK